MMAKVANMVCMFMLGIFLCAAAFAASDRQLKVQDLYRLCTSSSEGDKAACSFYILGVFEGASLGGSAVQDKSGEFREAKEKHFCVPDDLPSKTMERLVKVTM